MILNAVAKEVSTCTLTSDCICEGENGESSAECFGCWEDSVEFLAEIVKEWAGNFERDVDNIRVDGVHMGWQGVDGYGRTTTKDIHDTVTLRGDFRVVFTLKDGELKAERWSHDEPMGGAIFNFTPVDVCEDCDSEVEISVEPYGKGKMIVTKCERCGVSYDTDVD